MKSPKKEKPTYVCDYCHKHYSRERDFLKHKCATMVKNQDFKSVDGQTAWEYYQVWQQLHHRACQTPEAFMYSKIFTSCLKFVKFAKAVQLPFPIKFIKQMKLKKIQPNMWTHDQLYSEYMSYIDRDVSPIDWAKLSVNTLFEYAEEREVDISDVFSIIHPNEIIQLIRVRKLSAWLLLFSTKYVDIHCELSEEQQIIIEQMLKPSDWTNNLPNYRQDVLNIKKIIQELGL